MGHKEEVARLHRDDGVHLVVVGDVFPHAFHLAYLHVFHVPHEAYVADGVIGDARGREMADEFLFLELVHREVVARVGASVEMLHVGDDAGRHLQLHVFGVGGHIVHAVALVGVFEVHAFDVASGDDLRTQHETQQGDDYGADHIGPQEPLVAHAGSQHGDDLAVVCQFGGEEDDGEEDEQTGEEIGVEGNEVQIVVEDDGLPGRMLLGKFGYVLVVVEDDGDADDEHDAEKVRAQKLFDDIEVKLLHSRCPSCSMTLRFHSVKSPAMMWRRAVFTTSR